MANKKETDTLVCSFCNKTQNEVRKLMKPLLVSAFHQVTFFGRVGGGRDQLGNQFEDICLLAQGLEMNDDPEIRAKMKEYHYYNAWDLYLKFYEAGDSSMPHDNRKAFSDDLTSLFSLESPPYPTCDKVREVIEKHNIQLIDDINVY